MRTLDLLGWFVFGALLYCICAAVYITHLARSQQLPQQPHLLPRITYGSVQ